MAAGERSAAAPSAAITLDDGRRRLVVLPEMGAAFARFDARRADGRILPIFRPAPDGATDPSDMACYPLLPWSNRIRDGFPWHGERIVLAPNVAGERYPLHGDGWQRPWTVQRASATETVLALESAHQPPFDYAATMRCTLTADGLDVEMVVTHRGSRPAPYGLGLHPWLPRTPDTLLQATVAGVVGEDAEHMPTEWSAIDAHPEWDFRSPRALPERWINNVFTGWDGVATVEWPSLGLRLGIETTPPLPYCIVYSPSSTSPFFCFEPVSHAIDAHNCPDPVRRGLRMLGTGDRMRTTWSFRPEIAR